MLRLVFEAVMVIAVVSCLYFMMKLGEMDNKADEKATDEVDNLKYK
jgi:hypothetical protein